MKNATVYENWPVFKAQSYMISTISGKILLI